MKTVLTLTLWAGAAALILHATLAPEGGLIYRSPLAPLAIGLIGLGLCRHARQRQLAPAPVRTR